MYLRRTRRKKNGIAYDYWFLVESVRTAKDPSQRIATTIGKLPCFNKEEHIG
ncbi:MAG TPA: hypothetical protein PLY11_00025 [Syntrophorhabdus sp.]|nr:hypothetical protein [Syntrophorhabdus sp.]